jgi:hypothetical protein
MQTGAVAWVHASKNFYRYDFNSFGAGLAEGVDFEPCYRNSVTGLRPYQQATARGGDVAGAGGKGVAVVGVDPAGPAAEHGFTTGDIILDVGGKTVGNVSDVRMDMMAIAIALSQAVHAAGTTLAKPCRAAQSLPSQRGLFVRVAFLSPLLNHADANGRRC